MSREILEVFSPHDGHVIDTVPLQDASHISDALTRAESLFRDRNRWLPKYQRIEILEKTAALMEEDVEQLTRLAAQEGGKPYVDSKVEVLRAIQGVKLAASHIHTMAGEEIPMGITPSSANRLAFTIREPIGIAVSLSAFNHPLNLIIHQTIPMLAAGCPVIIKPASTTPLSCLNFVKILHKAGLPQDWCQTILCNRDDISKLVTDPHVAYLSFIGSSKAGWSLRSAVSPGTRCALEHGGAAPVIMEADADITNALPILAKGGYYHAGQVCVSVQRLFAHKSIAKEVARGLANLAEKLIVGDPLDKKTEVGPLILPREVDRVASWVDEAKSSRGEILTGGQKHSQYHYLPTVILNPSPDTKLSKQEVFGPVVCIYEYTDRQEAIDKANSLPFGFQAAVFTQNLDAMLQISHQLNATAVMVNDHTAFRVDWMPFGGRNESGLGMGGIPYTMHETTQEKLIIIKSQVL